MTRNEGVLWQRPVLEEVSWPVCFSRVATGAALVPVVGYLVLMGFAALAALQVGHWPYYAHPDPADVGPFRSGAVGVLIIAGFYLLTPGALVLMGVMMVMEQFGSERTVIQRLGAVLCRVVAFGIGAGLFLLALKTNEEWLMD